MVMVETEVIKEVVDSVTAVVIEEIITDLEEDITTAVIDLKVAIRIIMGEMEMEEEDIITEEMIHLQETGLTIMNPKGFLYNICNFTNIYVFEKC